MNDYNTTVKTPNDGHLDDARVAHASAVASLAKGDWTRASDKAQAAQAAALISIAESLATIAEVLSAGTIGVVDAMQQIAPRGNGADDAQSQAHWARAWTQREDGQS